MNELTKVYNRLMTREQAFESFSLDHEVSNERNKRWCKKMCPFCEPIRKNYCTREKGHTGLHVDGHPNLRGEEHDKFSFLVWE